MDGPSVVWSLAPGHTCGGSINASGVFSFTPAGPVPQASCVMSIRVSDGGTPVQSATQTATIQIAAVNDAPIASGDSYSVNEDNPLTVTVPGVLGNDSDPDGPGMTAVLNGGPAHGTLSLNANGSFAYTPALNYNGPDSFTYRASDGSLSSSVVTVSITVNAVNDAPTITAASGIARVQGTSAAAQIAAIGDIDNAVNTLAVTVNGSSSATVNGVTVSNIVANANGTVSANVLAACGSTTANFTLRATDPGALFAQATLTVTVTNETVAPVINPIANVVTTLPANTSANSMAVNFPLPTATDNCSTPTVTTNPVSGSTFNVGTTSVQVTAVDANGNIATATFTVTVRYLFSGFTGRYSNPPAVNNVSAGNTLLMQFNLSGNHGMNIFAAGSPSSRQVNCSTGAAIGASAAAIASNSLSFNGGQYTYYWQTNSAWAGTCRSFSITFVDGATYTANFSFYN